MEIYEEKMPISVLPKQSELRRLITSLKPVNDVALLGMQNNKPVSFDFGKFDHLLIVGGTDLSRDAMLVRVMQSLMVTHSQQELRIILTDYFGSFASYYKSPLMLSKPLESCSLMVTGLSWVLHEMYARSDEFRKSKARNFIEYNRHAQEKKPSIYFVCNTCDLLFLSSDRVPKLIEYILTKGKKFGIHLVLGSYGFRTAPELLDYWLNLPICEATKQEFNKTSEFALHIRNKKTRKFRLWGGLEENEKRLHRYFKQIKPKE